MTVCKDRRASYTLLDPYKRYSDSDNDSSWDRKSTQTIDSWPEDVEESSTKKVQEHWETMERTLHGESDQVPRGALMDECAQWKSQIPYFRVTGEKSLSKGMMSREGNSATNSTGSAQLNVDDVETIAHHSLPVEGATSPETYGNKSLRNEVLETIVDFLCSEMIRSYEMHNQAKTQEQEISAGDEFGDLLTVSPAPILREKNLKNSRPKGNSNGRINDSRRSSVKSKTGSSDSSDNIHTLSRKNSIAQSQSRRQSNNENCIFENESSRLYTPQIGRNRLGTIFNEKVLVSPVPFVVTKPSFTTLKTVPIQYSERQLQVSSSYGSSRAEMFGFNSANPRKSALMRNAPQSAWLNSGVVCPTAWPKNIKLAPIDSSTLPSSKIRSSTAASTIRLEHQRKPLAMPRTIMPPIPHKLLKNDDWWLEGKQIIVKKSSATNHVKTDWEPNSQTTKCTRRKTRSVENR